MPFGAAIWLLCYGGCWVYGDIMGIKTSELQTKLLHFLVRLLTAY